MFTHGYKQKPNADITEKKMMHYDIAAKVLIEKCRGEILRRFLGLSITESTLLEQLPRETVSVRRSDFPILVKDEKGIQRLVLLEIQSQWDRTIPLRLLDYRSRYLLKYKVDAISCVILLKPSSKAAAVYEDNEVRFAYHLIPIYDLDAREIIEEKVFCLMPFVPLMKQGKELVNEADLLIYGSQLPREDKADMLTVMTIFSGLVLAKLPQMLVSKRRDIMIESVAYDIIKQEGRQEGRQEGEIIDARESILDILEARFGVVPTSVVKAVQAIEELGVLKALRRGSIKIDNLDEFKNLLKKVQE